MNRIRFQKKVKKAILSKGSRLMCAFCLFYLISCEESTSSKTDNTPSYDPGQAVLRESFTPVEGGMATQVILKGENLGNDPKAVKVYFNHKAAPVVGCSNGRVLAITPRQPGDTCVISLVIGNDSSVFSQKYVYHTNRLVETIVGQKGTTALKTGSFGEATFNNPNYLTIDNEGNLFLAHESTSAVLLIDQQNRTVTQLFACPNKPNAPSTDMEGKVILVPADGGSTYLDTYFEFDPELQWAPRTRKVLHPTANDIASGMLDFTVNQFKHSFAICSLDGMIYFRSNRDGYLIRFNPKTRIGESMDVDGDGLKDQCNPLNSDTYLVFDPVNKSRMYCASTSQHCIHYFDVLTGETGVYAGKSGEAGWKDGGREEALFRQPRQMVLDNEGNLVIAEQGNHCIRQISPEGIVTTIVGIAGKADLRDGNPDDAMFNAPWGLAIDRRDGTIYIADRGNKCIRKLTIQ
ncbi:MAG: IPT/TIG domain-containing protein [Bacteroidales bacterium]|jgi:sugar lactone lactonase YvrE|nr:IPT/TIG domain-containing protein [Bacteroidales bacterium]